MEMTAESLHGPNNGDPNQRKKRQTEIKRECVKGLPDLNSYSLSLTDQVGKTIKL